MSWDFGMEVDVGGKEPATLKYDRNYTYNVSPMFYEAMGGDGIASIEGKTGEEAAPLLSQAIKAMVEEPEKYKAMNPANGWGDYDGALELLRDLRSWGLESPLARYYVH